MAQSAVKILNGKDAGEEFLSISQMLIEKDLSGAVLIDCANDYQGLGSEVKAAYTKYLRKEDLISTKSMPRIFREAGILASFKVAKNWTVVKNTVLGTEGSSEKVVNNNLKILDPDMTNYDKLKNKDKVFERMYAQQSTTNNIAAIINAFETIARAEYNDGNKDGGGGSGSGNGPSGNSNSGNTSSTIEGNGQIENPSKDKTFSDMEGHWAAAQVKLLAEKEIISGFPDGSFQPENPVTRAEFTKMILEAFGIQKNGKATFQDVPSTEWYAEYVAAAAEKGIVTGAENNMFLPNASITRQDAAVILYRSLSNYLTIEKGSTVFADLNSIAEYAREAVRDLASISIINGIGSNKFDPEGITTRAQAATLISNALDYMAAH